MRKIKTYLIIIFALLSFANVFAYSDITASFDPQYVYAIINFLNIIWLPFAILAGKLFSNDFIYWTFMHLDVILWKIWNFSKTFANFALAAILISSIFWLFVWKVKNIWSVLMKIWLWAILINMSWFIIWVLLDISTILIVSVWAFPMKMINNLSIQWETSTQKMCMNLTLKNSKTPSDIISCEKKSEENINLWKMMEKMNEISGPLVYIWSSILHLSDSWDVDKNTAQNTEKWKEKSVAKVLAIWTFIKLLVLVLFTVPIFILVIIWIIRLFWLWIYIWFSPFIILDQIFGWKMFASKKEFQLKNIFWLIFQPVIVVFVMGLALIYLSTLQKVMSTSWTKNNPNKQALSSLWITWNSMLVNDKPAITIEWNLLNGFMNSVWGFFWYTILLIMSSIILWSLLKLATKSSQITESIAENIYSFAEESLKAVPIIPIWKGVWIWAMEMAFHRGILSKWFEEKAAQRADALTNKILKAVWVKNADIGQTELSSAENRLRILKNGDFKTWYSNFSSDLSSVINSYGDLVPNMASNFKEMIYQYFLTLYNKKIANENDLSNIWFLKREDWKLVPVKGSDELFTVPKFREFLSWLIRYNKELKGKWYTNFSNLVNDSGVKASPDYLNKSLSEIASWK